jgi:predicted Zn-dependent peptidase
LSDRDRLKELKNIRRIDVIDHYKRTHTTSNMRFVVAGNLRGRQSAIERTIEKIKLPKGRGRIVLPAQKPVNVEAPVFVFRPSVKSCHFYIHTFARERLDDNSEDALHLVDSMLTATLHSRIFGEAREKGLVYHLASSLGNSPYMSSWHFEAQVLPRNLKALFEIIVREVQRVQAGDIAASDLEAAKMFELGRYQLGGQTVGGMTSSYSGRYFVLNEITNYDDIPNRIKSVNNQKIAAAVDRIFAEDIGSLGMLGNKTSRQLAEPLFEMIQPLWD